MIYIKVLIDNRIDRGRGAILIALPVAHLPAGSYEILIYNNEISLVKRLQIQK